MSSFNRAFLVIYSSLWILACMGLVALAWNRSQQLDLRAGDLNIQALVDASDSVRLAFTALMSVLALLGVITIITALSRQKVSNPASGRVIRVASEDGGWANVPVANIELLLRNELESFPEIRLANARVRETGQVVETDLELTIAPDAAVAYVDALAAEVTTAILRDRIGVDQFARPNVRTSFDTTGARSKFAGTSEPRLPANSVMDYLEPEALPEIQWEAPGTRVYTRPRPVWRQPAEWERASDE
jgi:hypothetical protein